MEHFNKLRHIYSTLVISLLLICFNNDLVSKTDFCIRDITHKSTNINQNCIQPKSKNIYYFYSDKFIFALEKNRLLKKIDKKNGAIIWQRLLHTNVLLKPIIKKKKIILFLVDCTLFIVKSKNGMVLYKQQLKKNISNLPIYKKQSIIINTIENDTLVFNIRQGKFIYYYKNLLISDKIIFYKKVFSLLFDSYIINYFINHDMICTNTFSYLTNWKKVLKKNEYFFKYNFSYSKKNLYIYNSYRNLASINIRTGKNNLLLRTRYYINDVIENKKLLIIFSKNNTIICVNTNSNLFLWKNNFLYGKAIKKKYMKKDQLILIDKKYIYIINIKNGNLIGFTKVN